MVLEAVGADLVVHDVDKFPIGQRITDGYINATRLCQACGKDWADYFEMISTKELLGELESDLGIHRTRLVQSTNSTMAKAQDTWVHPDIAVSLAQWCSAKFAVMVGRWVREWLARKLNVPSSERAAVYPERLSLAWRMQLSVPRGYWTVFDRSSNLLILVECDLKMPVDRYDLLDGSIGKRWSEYRKDRPWAGDRQTYDHIFPDNRRVQNAWAYQFKELPHFEQWLQFIYIPVHLPEYLAKKYPLSESARVFLKNLAERRLVSSHLP